MDIIRVGQSPIGRIFPLRGVDGRTGRAYDHFAYVPDPLPESVELSDVTHVRVGEAEAALARLDEASRQLPIPDLVRRPTTLREAHSTSALEGTHAPFEQVLEANLEETADPAVREVLNYRRIADAAIEDIHHREITASFLASLQGELVSGTRGESDDSGGLRKKPVVIGSQVGPIEEARFIPPEDGHWLIDGTERWERWVNAPHPNLSVVVQTALAHYQFETLHPFSDGNGRIGRLVIVLQLMRAEILKFGILAVSPWFEQRRRDYQDHLYEVTCTGDWDPWVKFFATGLQVSATAAHDRVARLLDFGQKARRLVQDNKGRGSVLDLADMLIGFPVFTVNWAAHELDVSFAAANRSVKKLVDLGLLRETTGRNYGRVFLAPGVLDIIAS